MTTSLFNKIISKLNAFGAWIKNHKLLSLGMVILLLIASSLLNKQPAESPQTNTEQVPVVRVIQSGQTGTSFEVVGTIIANQTATLSAEASGILSALNIEIGQQVSRGQVLGRISASDESAAITQANAGVEAARVQLRQAELVVQQSKTNLQTLETRRRVALQNVDSQERVAVNNLNRTLATTNLEAYLTSGSLNSSNERNNYTPPTISGVYNSSITGSYFIELYRSGADSGYSFRLSGLESGVGVVSTTTPQPLGTRGLSIQFSPGFEGGSSVSPLVWEVPIPNDRGNAFIANENNLRQTSTQFETARNQTLAEYQGLIDQANESLFQAQNSVMGARAGLNQAIAGATAANIRLQKKTIIAPFSGVIEDVMVESGEFINPGSPVANLVSEGRKEIRVEVPSNRINFIAVNDSVVINNDFEGVVSGIAPTVAGGSATVVISILGDEELLPGASARVRFGNNEDAQAVTDEFDDSITSLPLSSITNYRGQDSIFVINSEGIVEVKAVELGLLSGNQVQLVVPLRNIAIVENALLVSPGQRVKIQN